MGFGDFGLLGRNKAALGPTLDFFLIFWVKIAVLRVFPRFLTLPVGDFSQIAKFGLLGEISPRETPKIGFFGEKSSYKALKLTFL